ncbi:unnamed protein product [Arctia plantaginis]|uniref:Methyltransferase domain-containing protein n=1 Tax=Arctia plantaginis TaxID=874455 RepID=A0A8S0YTX6_ARCPL|nr:unnamed protein product [Arctia plantaginis]CAB3247931.1 unnamed protein product [Arctia plantaginis]
MEKPELYEECNYIHKRDVSEYLEKFKPKMKWRENNNRILDIGCGDGSVTNILKTFIPTDFKLVGCDISNNMVMYASHHHSNDQTSFTVLDIAGDLPEDIKGNFDHVFSFYALNWVIDQKRAFENIFNLLDKEGECFIILVAYNPVFEVYRTLSKNEKWSTWVYDVEKYISPYHDSEDIDDEIIPLMASVGFVDIELECKDRVFLFSDEHTRTKLMTAINPFQIPKNMYDEFMQDYLEVLNEIEGGHNIKDTCSATHPTLHYKSVVIHGHKSSAS